jgi:hypothetical protein
MDFFEVQYDTHTRTCTCNTTAYYLVLYLNSFGTTQFQSGSTAVSSLSTLHMVSDII